MVLWRGAHRVTRHEWDGCLDGRRDDLLDTNPQGRREMLCIVGGKALDRSTTILSAAGMTASLDADMLVRGAHPTGSGVEGRMRNMHLFGLVELSMFPVPASSSASIYLSIHGRVG
jgi:hypothetical protein